MLDRAKAQARETIKALATNEQEKLAMERGMVILADLLEEEL